MEEDNFTYRYKQTNIAPHRGCQEQFFTVSTELKD
jgi:hypothetical protein